MRPIEALKARRTERITQRYETYLQEGFPTAAFEGQPEPERLQCRNELDRTNWLGLVVKCQYAIAAGFGDLIEAGTHIRCTSNRMYLITPNDALARMLVLLTQADAAQQNWWRLKDEARTAWRREGLDTIDLEEGWP
jgi:hypothetical protein